MDAGVRVVFLDGEWSPEISGACAEVVGVRCVSQGDEIESDRIRSGDLVFFDFVSSESVELVRELRQKMEGVKAVVVAEGFQREKVKEALEFGIDGYLLMPLSEGQIVNAVTEVLLGGAPMSALVSNLVISSFHKKENVPAEFGLTGREREVLSGLAKGLPYKQLASELQMGMGTVRTHIRHLYKKLGVHSRTEAVVMYLGWMSPGNLP